MATPFDQEIVTHLQQAVNKALERRGRANIIISGNVGVGKSTLINAVFQGDLASTGDGSTVTEGIREIQKEGIPLSIFDTQGLENVEYRKIVKTLDKFLLKKQKDPDRNKHIHIAWICILEASRRIQKSDEELTKIFKKYDIPVVVVITKATSDQGFRRTVLHMLPEVNNVMRVHALEILDDNGNRIGIMGLKELIDAAMNLIPDYVRDALDAAQKVNPDAKVQRAHIAVAAAAASAAGIGLVPIPFSDAAAIIPIQITMLATISALWGIPVSQVFLGTLLSGTLTGSVGTIGGRALVGALLKFIPGPGSVVGGFINAGVAGTLTTTFGEAYIATLYNLTKNDPTRTLRVEEISEEFQRQLKRKK